MKRFFRKKIIFTIFTVFFFFFLIFPVSAATETVISEETVTETITESVKKPEPGTFFFTLGLNVLINTDSSLQSAPSPVLFTAGFGANIPLADFVQFSPHMSFFMNYYLWTGTAALPAEIENRTVLAPSLMFDLPFVFLIKGKNMVTSLGAGVAVLARYGFLASGVPAGEAYHTDLINKYFWDAARWFYPSAQVNWDYVFPSGLAAGAGLRVYFPISAAFDKTYGFAQNMLFSFSVRLHLPYKVIK